MRSTLLMLCSLSLLGCAVEATDSSPVAPVAEQDGIRGTLLETFEASSYSYLRLQTAEGELWAAVPRASLEIGEPVAVVNPQLMSDFESKTLGRRFDKIYFGTLEGGPAASSTAGVASNPHGGKQSDGSAPIEVAKAEGASGRTVAEIYAERDSLSGKSVVLRGQVVKYTAGIMGRNWIHLQDGSGAQADGTHDITVTSSETTTIGEVILVEGTLDVDKDFGSGYRYDVIVENARLK